MSTTSVLAEGDLSIANDFFQARASDCFARASALMCKKRVWGTFREMVCQHFISGRTNGGCVNESNDGGGGVEAEESPLHLCLTELCSLENDLSLTIAEANLIVGGLGVQTLLEDLCKRNATFLFAGLLGRRDHLTKLDLSGSNLGDAGALAFARTLPLSPSLASLCLSNNQIGGAGARALADALRKANDSRPCYRDGLTDLDLGCNEIGPVGAQALADTLRGTHASLTNLNLSTNEIGDAGAQAIADVLCSGGNTSLKRLNLWGNEIGDAGAQAIAVALKAHPTLTWLAFHFNQVGDAGAFAIAEALGTNTSLTYLNLNENKIGVAGAYALADAVKVNTTLTVLELFQNHIGEASALALADAAQVNTTATVLNIYLHDNDDGDRPANRGKGKPSLADALYQAKIIAMGPWGDRSRGCTLSLCANGQA